MQEFSLACRYGFSFARREFGCDRPLSGSRLARRLRQYSWPIPRRWQFSADGAGLATLCWFSGHWPECPLSLRYRTEDELLVTASLALRANERSPSFSLSCAQFAGGT
jgi:hypothetical protein